MMSLKGEGIKEEQKKPEKRLFFTTKDDCSIQPNKGETAIEPSVFPRCVRDPLRRHWNVLWKRLSIVSLIRERICTLLVAIFTLTILTPSFSASAVDELPQVVSISNIEGVTPPAADATPVTAIISNIQFSGTVEWSDKDGLLVGNFNTRTKYKAVINLNASPGYTFDSLATDFFTVAGAEEVTFSPETGIVVAIFGLTFEDDLDYLDAGFAADGSFNLFEIFGETPITQDNNAVSPLKIDQIKLDNEDRLVVLASFYSDKADRIEIGSGHRNSLAIAAQPGNESATSAALAALAYRGGNQLDWYLPSIDELAALYMESATVEGLSNESWSSTENSPGYARVFFTNNLDEAEAEKGELRGVRPIRAGNLVTPVIGSTGPGGGIIFFETSTVFACGPILGDTCNYLEAAPENWSGQDGDPSLSWATGIENQMKNVSSDNHILFRLNQDGSFDNNFGDAGTTLRKNSSDTPKHYRLVTTTGAFYVERVKLEIDPVDGVLVMLSGSIPGSWLGDYHNFIVRYNASGEIDESFGDTGVIGSLEPQSGFAESLLADITLDGEGRIVAASFSNINPDDILVQRFLANGVPDISFGESESATSILTINYAEDSRPQPVKNLQITADGSDGYLIAFTGFFCTVDLNSGEICPEDAFFTELFRLGQAGLIDPEFLIPSPFDGFSNLIPYFAFTDISPDGESGFFLSGTFLTQNDLSFYRDSGVVVRIGLDGIIDENFSGSSSQDTRLNPTQSGGCLNTASNNFEGGFQLDSSLAITVDYCYDVDEEPAQIKVKTYSPSGAYLGGAILQRDIPSDYPFTINQVERTNDGKIIVLAGTKPSRGLLALRIQGYGFYAPWSDAEILRYRVFDGSVTPPIPVEARTSPVNTPYLKTMNTPKIYRENGKIFCKSGTYTTGLTGNNGGTPVSSAIFKPTSFEFNLYLDGVRQESLSVTSESSTASWIMPKAAFGSVITCSVSVSAFGNRNIDWSTDNISGVASAQATQKSAIAAAHLTFSESISANSKSYKTALLNNSLKWRSELEKIRRDQKAATLSKSSESIRAARKRINAEYISGKPAALEAKEAADRQASDQKLQSIAKAMTTFGIFIESIGYGILIY